MILEEVVPHPFRVNIYINSVITPCNKVKKSDALMVKRILMTEIVQQDIKLISQY
jgi:hypothetical protein